MDRITREAIDERLRVLEGVSGAVYRCIEDLMRMRSTLPSPTIPSQPTPFVPPMNPAEPSSDEHPLTNGSLGHTSPVVSTPGSGSSKVTGPSSPTPTDSGEPEGVASELANAVESGDDNIINP